MKKCIIVSFVALFFVFSLFANAYAETAKDAVMGLKKLQARCQAGISYKDYGNALGDAKFPVNLFIESADARKYPELAASIAKVMKHYEYAGTVWTHKVSERYGAAIGADSSFGKEIKRLYPQVQQIQLAPELKSPPIYGADSVLRVIWETASEELDNTTKLYAAIGEKSLSEIEALKKENSDLRAEVDKLIKENDLLRNPKKTKKGR